MSEKRDRAARAAGATTARAGRSPIEKVDMAFIALELADGPGSLTEACARSIIEALASNPPDAIRRRWFAAKSPRKLGRPPGCMLCHGSNGPGRFVVRLPPRPWHAKRLGISAKRLGISGASWQGAWWMWRRGWRLPTRRGYYSGFAESGCRCPLVLGIGAVGGGGPDGPDRGRTRLRPGRQDSHRCPRP